MIFTWLHVQCSFTSVSIFVKEEEEEQNTHQNHNIHIIFIVRVSELIRFEMKT